MALARCEDARYLYTTQRLILTLTRTRTSRQLDNAGASSCGEWRGMLRPLHNGRQRTSLGCVSDKLYYDGAAKREHHVMCCLVHGRGRNNRGEVAEQHAAGLEGGD
jgi:hypothetical protein